MERGRQLHTLVVLLCTSRSAILNFHLAGMILTHLVVCLTYGAGRVDTDLRWAEGRVTSLLRIVPHLRSRVTCRHTTRRVVGGRTSTTANDKCKVDGEHLGPLTTWRQPTASVHHPVAVHQLHVICRPSVAVRCRPDAVHSDNGRQWAWTPTHFNK